MRWLAYAVLFGLASAVFAADEGLYTSVCDCEYSNTPCHGEFRWAVKTEIAPVAGCRKITPSVMSHWPDLAPNSATHSYKIDEPRAGRELQCWQVTGRVVLVRAEPDGDLHVQLADATNSNSVNTVVEIPAGEPWCQARTVIFGLVNVRGAISAPRLLTITSNAVLVVTGRAFYDGAHAGGRHAPNRRNYDPNVTIWEIHPVMEVSVK